MVFKPSFCSESQIGWTLQKIKLWPQGPKVVGNTGSWAMETGLMAQETQRDYSLAENMFIDSS